MYEAPSTNPNPIPNSINPSPNPDLFKQQSLSPYTINPNPNISKDHNYAYPSQFKP